MLGADTMLMRPKSAYNLFSLAHLPALRAEIGPKGRGQDIMCILAGACVCAVEGRRGGVPSGRAGGEARVLFDSSLTPADTPTLPPLPPLASADVLLCLLTADMWRSATALEKQRFKMQAEEER